MARNNVTNVLSNTGTFRPRTVFDVGANVGMSTSEFRDTFPDVHVYAFEPVSETFDALQKAVSGDPLVTTEKIALGSREMEALMLQMRRAQSPAKRMESGFRMTELVQSFEIGMLRRQNPQATEEEFRYLLTKKRYGAELADKAFGARRR